MRLIERASNPQEEEESWLEVPRICLDETMRRMDEAVHMRPSDLVLNMDEVGISEWENRKSTRVVVSIMVSG
jgi:hypothetical protein